IGAIERALDRAYPHARTALRYRHPFELLVATILSAQCTDETVNRVTPALFARHPTPAKLAVAEPAEIEPLVRPTGFFRQKTKSILGCARAIVERFGGEAPATGGALGTLPAGAPKPAKLGLANARPPPP